MFPRLRLGKVAPAGQGSNRILKDKCLLNFSSFYNNEIQKFIQHRQPIHYITSLSAYFHNGDFR